MSGGWPVKQHRTPAVQVIVDIDGVLVLAGTTR